MSRTPTDPKRLLEIEEMLTSGLTRARIYDLCNTRYGIGWRQAERNIAVIHKRWNEEAAKSRPIRKTQMRIMLLGTYRKAMAAKKFNAAVQALAQVCKIDGLDAPERIEISTGMVTTEQASAALQRANYLAKLLRLPEGASAPSPPTEDDSVH